MDKSMAMTFLEADYHYSQKLRMAAQRLLCQLHFSDSRDWWTFILPRWAARACDAEAELLARRYVRIFGGTK